MPSKEAIEAARHLLAEMDAWRSGPSFTDDDVNDVAAALDSFRPAAVGEANGGEGQADASKVASLHYPNGWGAFRGVPFTDDELASLRAGTKSHLDEVTRNVAWNADPKNAAEIAKHGRREPEVPTSRYVLADRLLATTTRPTVAGATSGERDGVEELPNHLDEHIANVEGFTRRLCGRDSEDNREFLNRARATLRAAINRAVRAAVEAEREACAKVCDEKADSARSVLNNEPSLNGPQRSWMNGAIDAYTLGAAAIRALAPRDDARGEAYPPESAPRVTFSQHDEQRCDLCRALNEAKAQHYKMLPGPTITVRP